MYWSQILRDWLLCDIHESLFSMFIYWVPCMVLRYLWDRSHVYISDSNGTDPKSNFETTMDISEFEKSKKSHVSILGTYGTSPMSRLYASMGLVPLVPYDVMGPCGKHSRHGVPCVTLRKLWDRSHIVLHSVQTDLWDRPHMCFWEQYGTGPMYVSKEAMGTVPYVILRHLGLVGGGGW